MRRSLRRPTSDEPERPLRRGFFCVPDGSRLTFARVESSCVGSKALGRTIAYFMVVCTLLVVLAMTVLNGGASDSGVLEAIAPQAEPAMATLPTSESQPTAATAKAEAQSPPRSEANVLAAITRQPLPEVVSPPWADEMEGVILNYIAQRPGLELTELQVQCAEEQCVIFLGGNSSISTKWALTCLRASMDSTVPSFRAWTAARTVLCICADERKRTNAHLRPQRPARDGHRRIGQRADHAHLFASAQRLSFPSGNVT